MNTLGIDESELLIPHTVRYWMHHLPVTEFRSHKPFTVNLLSADGQSSELTQVDYYWPRYSMDFPRKTCPRCKENKPDAGYYWGGSVVCHRCIEGRVFLIDEEEAANA
jgi:hypothetical protein